jgi:hypothetical protein
MCCICPAIESAHHHVLNAIYPCDGYTSCQRCRDLEERLWKSPAERAQARGERRWRAGYPYARGGALPAGRMTAVNTSGRPERVERAR